MPVDVLPSDIPVLLVYNLDPAWSAAERSEVRAASEELGAALAEQGHPVAQLEIGHEDITCYLEAYHPLEQIVFNWCEGLPGEPQRVIAARAMEELDSCSRAQARKRSPWRRTVPHQVMSRAAESPRGVRISSSPDAAMRTCSLPSSAVNEHCSEGITPSPWSISRTSWPRESTTSRLTISPPGGRLHHGREFHVSLWGNGRLEMLPPAEMDFSLFPDIHDRLCTYEAKFSPGSVPYENIRTLLPAPLSPEELREIERVCKAAYQALACRDYARIDVRCRDGVFYVLDVNPNADISSDASMACAAELAGFSYGQMGSRLVRLAAARHPAWGKG